MFPWIYGQKPKATTPREIMIERLREGVPPELASRAAGIDWADVKDDPEIDKALCRRRKYCYSSGRAIAALPASYVRQCEAKLSLGFPRQDRRDSWGLLLKITFVIRQLSFQERGNFVVVRLRRLFPRHHDS